MKHNKIKKSISIGFFFFWLVVLYIGADHPPPRGFIGLIILDAIAGIIVYYRLSDYLLWQVSKRKLSILRVLGDGIFVGLVFGGIVILANPGGEPSVSQNLIDYMIWLIVLSLVGLVNSLAVYGLGGFLLRRMKSD